MWPLLTTPWGGRLYLMLNYDNGDSEPMAHCTGVWGSPQSVLPCLSICGQIILLPCLLLCLRPARPFKGVSHPFNRPPRTWFHPLGDLVQVHATKWVHNFASIKKLIPMWSIPHHIVAWQLNSYTLETLSGLPPTGLYNLRWLWAFEPQAGTKLAMDK